MGREHRGQAQGAGTEDRRGVGVGGQVQGQAQPAQSHLAMSTSKSYTLETLPWSKQSEETPI